MKTSLIISLASFVSENKFFSDLIWFISCNKTYSNLALALIFLYLSATYY